MIYEQFGDLKFKYRNREFWCRVCYVDTAGKNKAKIQDYIKHQPELDKRGEQLSLPYPGSPFTGASNRNVNVRLQRAPARAQLVKRLTGAYKEPPGYAGG